MAQAAEMVTNNDFTMQDSYYSTYIGARLDQMEGKDSDESYCTSPEYDDLRCLLQPCSPRALEVLSLSVHMTGARPAYTGLSPHHHQSF